jgi:uncharacterized protein (DUF849 family)
MLLKIALNGARPKSENSSIPQSIEEIIEDVQSIYRVGYHVFHIHCYDKHGNESIEPEDVSALVSSIKRISPQIQIGISTGDWIEPDLDKRIRCIEGWNVAPDFVSVNMIEHDALTISKILMKKGVLIEAGLSEEKAAEIFVKSELDKGCIRILVEPEEEDINGAMKTVTAIEHILNRKNNTLKRLLHGFNSTSWELLKEAQNRGYDGRMGLEDTIYLENGKKVTSNLELIQAAASMNG